MEFRLFEMFSGVGGFSKAFYQVFPDGKIVGCSEIDKYAKAIYKYNYYEIKNYGDITRINVSELPNFNIATFGFPCQDVSIAGKRGGLQSQRSGLFFEAMRIIGAKKPPYFVFENVKGLFSSNNGKDFQTVLQTISDVGYDGQWQLLNTRWLLPQNRERIFFVGHRRGIPRPQIFPFTGNERIFDQTDKSEKSQSQTEYCSTPLRASGNDKSDGTFIITKRGKGIVRDYASALTATEKSGGNHSDMDYVVGLKQVGSLGESNSDAQRVYDGRGIAKTLKGLGGGQGAKTGLYVIGHTRDKSGKSISHHLKDEFGTIKTPSGNQSEYIIHNTLPRSSKGKGGKGHLSRENGDVYTLDTNANRNAIEFSDEDIRRLTPIECERLQGFPDNWTKYGIFEDGSEKEISDTQRYKCLGNAVTVDIVRLIFQSLKNEVRLAA